MYAKVRWAGNAEAPELEVEVAERANGRPVCSACCHSGPGYDRRGLCESDFDTAL